MWILRSSSNQNATIHVQTLPENLSTHAEQEEEICVENIRASKWLTVEDDHQRDLLSNFLLSRTSKTTVTVVGVPVTLVFGFYLYQYIADGTESDLVMIIARVIRFVSCIFIWLHLYYIKFEPSAKKAMFCADQYMLWNAIVGSMIMVIRCLHGSCDDHRNEDTCNPRHEDRGVPADTLVANLSLIALLPVIFKAHNTDYLKASYCVTFFGMIAGTVIARAISDIPLIFCSILAFGVMMYDYERNMITMFLLFQKQKKYYDRLLAGERATATAEIEKDELRNLIGSVAHDLKTPLHAIMADLDGLQKEVEAVRQHLVGLSLAQSPEVAAHASAISERTSEAQVYIDSLRDIYQFMVMAINRAIEFRKTAAGLALMASNETFHLPKAADWAVKRFENNPSGVEIRVETCPTLSEGCPFVITDKHWFTENVLTLLSNAVKFTSRGEIALRMCLVAGGGATEQHSNSTPPLLCKGEASAFEIHRDATQRRVSAEWVAAHPSDECFIRVEVEDTGIGVSPAAAHILFQPFGKSQARAGGAGLGLFSLRKRMEVLGGSCGMLPRADGRAGCCFWFSIPYVPDTKAWQEYRLGFNHNRLRIIIGPPREVVVDAAACSEDGVESNKSSTGTASRSDSGIILGKKEGDGEDQGGGSKVVLVVDDSALILKTTARMLRKEGFEVETAQNGEEGLRLMQSHSYSFVLSDIQMPVMDGLEMAQRIRLSEIESDDVDSRPQRRVIIGMSANSDSETRDESLACGMDAFIPKPVRMAELLKQLKILRCDVSSATCKV